ncbi:MAG: CBS domain-containing protein [Microthrixaceae bacterium]
MSLSPSDPVERLITGPPVAVHPEDTLLTVAEMLIEDGIGAVVVRGTEGPSGVVSERDIVNAVVDGVDLDADRASDVMAMDVLTIDAAEPISAAATAMITGSIRHLPVVSDGVVVGVVSIRDVLAVYAA